MEYNLGRDRILKVKREYYKSSTMEIGVSTLKKTKINYSLLVRLLFITVISALNANYVFGEGTRELLVNTVKVSNGLQFDTTKSLYNSSKVITTPANCIQIWDGGPSAGGIGRITGTYNTIPVAWEKYRIKIRVCKAGEVINFGFNPNSNITASSWFRLYRGEMNNGATPASCIKFDGTSGSNLTSTQTVTGGTTYSYKIPTSAGAGYIQYYSQAAVGPQRTLDSVTTVAGQLGFGYPVRSYKGYTPYQYIVQAADIDPVLGYTDFFIVMNGTKADPVQTTNILYAMFDVTVWDDAVKKNPIKARLFSSAWDFNCNSNNSPSTPNTGLNSDFNSKLYFYSKDSVVTAVTFTRMSPYGVVICANATGTSATGNLDKDRRSVVSNYGTADFPIFFNSPYDTATLNHKERTCGIVPKIGGFGKITSASITGCDNDRCINLTADKTGMAGITLLPPVDGDFVPRVFPTTALHANTSVCIPWDGNDGAGNPIINEVKVEVNYFNGLTNLPLYDVEENKYGYIIDLIAPKPNPGTKPIVVYWNDVPYPGSGGPDITNGQSLDGLYDKPLAPANGTKIGYYDGNDTPVEAFVSHSSYNLFGCDPTIDHHPATAIIEGCHLWTGRGANVSCPGTAPVNCAETMNTWWNANVVTVDVPYVTSNVHVYADTGAVPKHADGTGGNASSKIKSTCYPTGSPISINGVVRIDPSIVSVADAIDVTNDNPGTGKWKVLTGSGTFVSTGTTTSSSLSDKYKAVAADSTRGYVLLQVISDVTAQTPCGSANDTLRINLTPGPHVWTRPGPITVCASNALVYLDPGTTGDSSGVNKYTTSFAWTAYDSATPTIPLGGSYVSDNQSLGSIATYTPPTTYTSGTIIMRLKSTNAAVSGLSCPADSAQFTIKVNKIPTREAGGPITICNVGGSGATNVTLSTTIANPTINGGTSTAGFNILWTGNGTFSNQTTLYPTYTPTDAELALGVAKIFFNVTQNSTPGPSCATVTDTLIINITSPPTANAGPDITLCKNNLGTIKLNGVATNSTAVSWSITAGGGTGNFTFVPSGVGNDTATFTPTGALKNSYTLTMKVDKTFTGGSCPSVTDDAILTLTDTATITAMSAINYCPENPVVQLNAVVTPGFSGQWFIDNAGTINPAGTFSSSSTDPNAKYTLAPTEVGLLGFGLVYRTSTVGNLCKAQYSGVPISPISVPTITLPDVSSCNNKTTVTLTATLSAKPFTSFTWSSLGTSQNFSPITKTTPPATTTFTPSATDIGNGSVKVVFSLQPTDATCAPTTDTMVVYFTPGPIADAGADHNVCSNNASVPISGSVTPSGASGAGHTWSIVSGGTAGTIAAPANLSTTFTASGTPTVGSKTKIVLTATLAGCNNYSDTAVITYTAPPTLPTITPLSSTVCANNSMISLKGTSPSTGALHWTSGSNCPTCFTDTNAVFTPDSTIYTPKASDISAGSVTFTATTRNNGNCNAVSSSTTVNIAPIPTVSINNPTDTTVCENNDTISLSATVARASGGTWSSSSGCSSCFSTPNSLNTNYIPSPTDLANGTVTFTLNTTGNLNSCLSVQAKRKYTIYKAPTVNAGPDLTVCNNLTTVALSSASSTNTSSTLWKIKSGAGSITNAPSLTSAVYNINSSDHGNTVIVVLVGNGNGVCTAVQDERIIQFTDLPTADAGPDKTVCKNDAPAILDGSGSSGGTWTCSGCATTITTPGSLTASYAPLTADINKTLTFTYTVPAAGGCPTVSDAVNIHFNPAPTVSTGGPYTLCGNLSTVNLTGTFSNATGVVWTSTGTGSFGNQFSANTTYVPSSADTSGTGVVSLTLTTTGSDPCSAVSDTKTLTISKPIILSAGPDQTKCGISGSVINLNGSLSGATFNSWSIVGASSGTLNNPTSLTGATYTVGASDAGTTVTFKALSNANASGTCTAQSDLVVFTFTSPAVVTANAGSSDICQTSAATLNGTITNANTGTWACTNCTAGLGSFSPDNTYNKLTPQTSVQFYPAPADTSKASLTFVLTSDNVNVCGSVASTTVTVNLHKKPAVSAGSAKTLCENNNVYTLQGKMTNSTTGVWRSGFTKTTGFSPVRTFDSSVPANNAVTYDPDTIDVQNGFVTLTLFTTGSAFCPVDSSKVTITFSKAPKVNAGLDRTICKNNPTFNLVGTITPSSGFTTTWTSPNCGSSCFSSPNALITNYTLKYPADTLGSSLKLFLTATDPTGLCSPAKDTVVVNLSEPPRAKITTTFPNPICTDQDTLALTGTVSSGGFNWSTNGTGTFMINAYQASVVYPFTAADRARAKLAAPNNKVRIYLGTDNGFCLPVKDSVDVTLVPAPVVTFINTFDSTTICANQSTLDVSASVDQPGYKLHWTTSGGGTYTIDPTTSAQITTYKISPIDIAAKTIILVAHTVNPPTSTCLSASAQYKLKITPLPVPNAGSDNTVCQTTHAVDLSDASSINATSSMWSTSGSGVFGITNQTVGTGSVYYPSTTLPTGSNDVDKPSVTLTLTAFGCDTVSDTRVISFTPKPSANAGNDQTICNETGSVSLSGTATNSSSVTWNVQGSASSFATTSAATYSITASDRSAGFVNLVYTVKGNGSCSPVTDTVKVTILPQPTINIGPDVGVCSKSSSETHEYNFPVITLTNGITPTWSATGTGLDAFNPTFPTYTITNADITAGSVTIIATTRSSATLGCGAVTDAMVINISKAPTLNIGPDIHVCDASTDPIQMNYTSTNSSGAASWSSDNAGSFDDPNAVPPVFPKYTAVPTEHVAGNITNISATINGQGACPSVSDTLQIFFEAAPVLAQLKDTTICFTSGVAFNYTVASGILGDWTSGAGTILPPGASGQQSIVVNYAPISAGSFSITFDPSDVCYAAQTATGTVTLVESPSVMVTSPLNVCNNNMGAITLSASPLHNGTVTWSTVQGFGTIGSPSPTGATYTPKADSSDFALDSIMVKVTVQETSNLCPAAVDTISIRTHKAPTISVTNQIACSDVAGVTDGINLTASVTPGFTTLWSMGSNATAINTPGSVATTATISGFQASFTITATGLDGSCTPVSATLTIDKEDAPTFATPGTDIAGCSNGNLINLNNANITPSSPGGYWSKKQPPVIAGGTFNPSNIGATGVTYSPSASDIAAGSIDLVYTINNTGVCTKGYHDTIKVTFNSPITIQTVNPVETFCAQDNSVNLVATTTPSTYAAGPVITWSVPNGVGVLTQTPSPGALTAFYDPNPSKIPNSGDVANGGAVLMVKLTNVTGCPDDSSYVSLILVPEPAAIVNAGSSQQVCVDRTSVNLQGLVINADGGLWSINKAGISTPAVAATGTFANASDLETQYFLSAADKTKSKIRLYLFSVGGNARCHQVVDSVDISFTAKPVPSASTSAPSVCADVDSIPVSGHFTMAGINGIWTSSGDGIYTNIGIYDSIPVYVPGPADIASGKVTFTYSSYNYQDCQSYSASASTIITPKIVADAGPNLVVCGNNSTGITITASSPPNNTGIWKPLGVLGKDYGGKFTQINAHQATYIPADTVDPTIAAITFRYTTTGSSPCKADSAQMVLKVAPSPTVIIAANQQSVCNDATSINLSVTSMTVATSGYWNTSGTGSFVSDTAKTTKYNFSKSDLDSSSITITFITTGNISNGSICNPAGDAVTITLKPKPVVDANASNTCVTSSGIVLDNSSVTQVGNPAVSGIWTASSGTLAGQFSADQFIANADPTTNVTSYYPSTKDISNGTVTLTLTSTGAGTCLPISRSVILNVSPTPIADAGKDLFVCTDSSVTLKANPQTNLVSYSWQDITTPGTAKSGIEVKDGPITVNRTYVLTVIDNKGCNNTDTMVVNTVTDPNLTQVIEQCYDYYGYVHVNIGGTVSPLGGFQWYYNSSLMSSETRDSVRVTQPGYYQVRYSLGGCTDASNRATDILDIPRIKTTNYIACKNTTVTATVTEIPNAQLSAMGLMPFTYDWSPASASISNTAVLPTSTVNPLVADTIMYYVTPYYTTPSGTTCKNKDSVRVISIPVPQPVVKDTTQACTGVTVNFDASASPSNISALSAFNPVFKWYTESSTSSLGNTHLFSTSTTNNYVVSVTIDQCVGKDTAVVLMRPYPAKVVPSNVVQCFEQVGSVTLDAGPGSVGTSGFTGVTYQWTSGSGDPALSTSTSETTVITYSMIKDLDDEEIIAYAHITNHFGTLTCTNIDTTVLKDICVPRLFPPTAFHPTNGGSSGTGGSGGTSGTGNLEDEYFTIKGKYFTNFKITIYSRWGEVIYYSEDPDTYWDGTYRGELMPVGVYAYIITYEGKDDQTKGPFKKEGRVVLIR